MFGSYRPILEVFPNYMLDYQEWLESEVDERWIDRLVPDGSWSGNLGTSEQIGFSSLI